MVMLDTVQIVLNGSTFSIFSTLLATKLSWNFWEKFAIVVAAFGDKYQITCYRFPRIGNH